jgi:hypothetical protein
MSRTAECLFDASGAEEARGEVEKLQRLMADREWETLSEAEKLHRIRYVLRATAPNGDLNTHKTFGRWLNLIT